MSTVVLHDSQLDVPVGNIFELWEFVEPIVERIHRNAGEEWGYTVTLAAGTRLVVLIADPVEGVFTEPADRSVWLYRTPRSMQMGSFLRIICVRGTFIASVVNESDVREEVRERQIAEWFLHE